MDLFALTEIARTEQRTKHIKIESAPQVNTSRIESEHMTPGIGYIRIEHVTDRAAFSYPPNLVDAKRKSSDARGEPSSRRERTATRAKWALPTPRAPKETRRIPCGTIDIDAGLMHSAHRTPPHPTDGN